ncbi:hypothetical protein TRFO_26164 [Tritrichomonas foetus]|uniref:PLAC8 family protein n=1 Tax=Tritrichomonas foetus TaxID=1144522 RepID=A0A1J4K935_9EUKA|nr:hypothetical protein TRFO_26164 [Tritrichomonas foetus]|eukprot:OHT05949.1 hypothetical protein TRFO_26164 [Tritrichomonas foetus]
MIDAPAAAHTGALENTLFGCFSDCGICIQACFCYECAKAKTWADVRGESCSCCHLYAEGFYIRANMKQLRGVSASLCADCCVYSFCPSCALAQDMRELKLIKELPKDAPAPTQNYDQAQAAAMAGVTQVQPPGGYVPPTQGYAPAGYAPPPPGYNPQYPPQQ